MTPLGPLPRGCAQRRVWTLLLLGFLVFAAALPGEPRRYEIDPDHLTVAFLVDHVGFAKVLGLFQRAAGSFVFDETRREVSAVRVVVQTDSVFTNQERRDRHLRSRDFLHCEQYPEMVFESSGTVRLDEDGEGRLEGNLTLLGVTRPLTLDITWNRSAPSPLDETQPYTLGASARGAFRRSRHEMTYGVANGWVGDEIEVIIELEARQGPPP